MLTLSRRLGSIWRTKGDGLIPSYSVDSYFSPEANAPEKNAVLLLTDSFGLLSTTARSLELACGCVINYRPGLGLKIYMDNRKADPSC